MYFWNFTFAGRLRSRVKDHQTGLVSFVIWFRLLMNFFSIWFETGMLWQRISIFQIAPLIILLFAHLLLINLYKVLFIFKVQFKDFRFRFLFVVVGIIIYQRFVIFLLFTIKFFCNFAFFSLIFTRCLKLPCFLRLNTKRRLFIIDTRNWWIEIRIRWKSCLIRINF